jgi:hypothetical protein
MASCDTIIRAANRVTSNGRTVCNLFAGQSVQQLQRMLEQLWDRLPKQARQLLVEAAQPVDLRALVAFWTLPMWREFARGTIALNLSDSSSLMALIYLKLGQVTEARALALNGAFIRQCAVSSTRPAFLRRALFLEYLFSRRLAFATGLAD